MCKRVALNGSNSCGWNRPQKSNVVVLSFSLLTPIEWLLSGSGGQMSTMTWLAAVWLWILRTRNFKIGLSLKNLQSAICFTATLIGALTWCHLLLRLARIHTEQFPQWVSCGDTPTTPRLSGRDGRALGLPVRPKSRQYLLQMAYLRKGGLASLKRQGEKHCTLSMSSLSTALPPIRQPAIHWRLTHRFHEWNRR